MPDTHSYFSPPPAPSARPRTRRRRRRRHLLLSPLSAATAAARTSSSPLAASSSAASSPASSSAGGLSLFSLSRSPSPFHHLFFLSPLHAAASTVPFAWEHRPGVPKTPPPARQCRRQSAAANKQQALPLPPARILLSGSSKVSAAIAAAEEDDDDCFAVVPENLNKEMRPRSTRDRRRQPALVAATLTDCLAVLRLCRSCTTMSRDCLTGTPPPAPCAMAGRKAALGGYSASAQV